MLIFVSWSGQRSRHVAQCLREWLPHVIQACDVWMSEEDIVAGTRWSNEIAKKLEGASFGIVCATPENLERQWLNFEAGAISKALDDSCVCPYLLDLTASQVTGPLSAFNAISADADGTKKLLKSINEALEQDKLSDGVINLAFEKNWPELQEKLKRVPSVDDVPEEIRPTDDMMAELVGNTRELLRITSEMSRSGSAFHRIYDRVSKSQQPTHDLFGDEDQLEEERKLSFLRARRIFQQTPVEDEDDDGETN